MDDKCHESWSQLHEAAYRGDVKKCESLIAKGLSLSVVDNYGYSPLHIAVQHGRTIIVKLLIKSGAVVNQRNNNGSTPLHAAASRINPDMAQILIMNGALTNVRNNYGLTPLHLTPSAEVAIFLVTNRASVNVADYAGNTPLHETSITNRRSVEQILLKRGAKDDVLNKKGATPRDMAIQRKQLEKWVTDKEHGAKDDVSKKKGATPGIVAIADKNDLQSRLNVLTKSFDENPYGSHYEKCQAQIEDLYNDVKKAIVYEPSTIINYRVVESESEDEDDDDKEDEEEETKESTSNKGTGTIPKRRQEGQRKEPGFRRWENVAPGSETGAIPKRGVAKNIGEEVSSKSDNANAKSVPFIRKTLRKAYLRDDSLNFMHFVGDDPNQVDESGSTPLMSDSFRDEEKIADIFREGGPNINVTNNLGDTTFMLACLKYNLRIRRVMLKSRFDINATDNESNTALHYAAASNDWRIAEFLSKSGAKQGEKNREGQTASDVALSMGHGRLAAHLDLYLKLEEIRDILAAPSMTVNVQNININQSPTINVAQGNDRVIHSSNNNFGESSGPQNFE